MEESKAANQAPYSLLSTDESYAAKPTDLAMYDGSIASDLLGKARDLAVKKCSFDVHSWGQSLREARNLAVKEAWFDVHFWGQSLRKALGSPKP